MTMPTHAATARILFIHHSVGRNLIRDGGLRELLAQRGDPAAPVELWDHDYNKLGLYAGDGEPAGHPFPMPGDDTDPPALARLFTGDDAQAREARSLVLAFDVVALKSCYPNSAIADASELASLFRTYRTLIDALAAIPETQFVLLSSPPLAPARTTAAQADRARTLATWLAGPAAAHVPNVRVLDLFDRLAEPSDGRHPNRLRSSYRRMLPIDSHPNARASREVAPLFADVLLAAVAEFRRHVQAGVVA